ncbi:SDR family oxidoreductase [Blastococcus sp. CT_GayMR20]|uniref:SDR family oxidoreductase n=1 Tax=Blastococcus sp. CT_GayMR20 TaxID=2559609 RepID=UPI0010747E9F|nr:SDR family oxidoreductase [Blastococcus sp. CT_GayMR20]TFV93010.1 SDR family oxidoreductase [Blastococcus sp. CT_GayMR20]
MSIIVTGATGHLGRLAVEGLLARGVPAEQIVATGRRIDTLTDLQQRGVTVRRADYTDPASLRAAFAGAKQVLLVSSSEVGQRLPQHRNAITAAKDTGVGLIAYTSLTRADTSTLLLADEHRGTEQALAESGVPHVLLRNGWYTDNYTDQLPTYLQHGIVGSAGTGQVSAATRADYAEAAAAVLTTDGHEGAVYELGGEPFAMPELAAAVSAATGQDVTYTDVPVEQYTRILVDAGLPEPVAAVYADGDRGAADGELYVEGNDLDKLIGRAPTSLTDAVTAAVARLRA